MNEAGFYMATATAREEKERVGERGCCEALKIAKGSGRQAMAITLTLATQRDKDKAKDSIACFSFSSFNLCSSLSVSLSLLLEQFVLPVWKLLCPRPSQARQRCDAWVVMTLESWQFINKLV